MTDTALTRTCPLIAPALVALALLAAAIVAAACGSDSDNLVGSYQQEFEQVVEECTQRQRAAHGYVRLSEVEDCANKFERLHRFFQSDDARAKMSFDDFQDWGRRASREALVWRGRAQECRDTVKEYSMCARTVLR